VVVVVATLPAEVVTVVAGRLSVVTSGLVVVVVTWSSGWATPEVELPESELGPSGSEPGSPPPQATRNTRLKSRVLVG
jgi:hypothetical protein